MAIQLNHTIVPSHDKVGSAQFLADILGLPAPKSASHFVAVEIDDGVTLDYDNASSFNSHHYAFLVSDEEFDAIFGRVEAAAITYFADPGHQASGELNHRGGGRGFYFDDPDGHNMEVFTRSPL